MRFHHACIESIATALPDEKWTSAGIEERLKPLYDRLKLPAGRLELMTGIRELKKGFQIVKRKQYANA